MTEPTKADSHKLIYHPKRVADWHERGDCYPIYIEIGPTNRCNHNCVFCALDWLNHEGSYIDKELMVSTLEEMAQSGVKSVMFAGEGEPLLHKDITLFVEKAKKYKLDVSITTNGVLFDKKMADKILPYLAWIRFSIDAVTPETYLKIHRGSKNDFEKVIRNISYSAKFKKIRKLETTIGVQFLMIPQNVDEVVRAAKIYKQIGTDNIQIKPYSQHPSSINKFIINYKDYAHLEDELEKLNSDNFKVLFRKQTMQRVDEGIVYPECYGLPFFALVDAKGNIIPCNLFYNNPEFTYGNLNEKNFSQIWKSEKRKQVLEKLRNQGVEHCRHACRLDVINQYLHRLKNPFKHDNFI